MSSDERHLDADRLRDRFGRTEPFTVGLEEEVLLIAADGLDPVPRAAEVVARAACPGVKQELPPCQVELVTRVHPTVAGAVEELVRLRRRLAVAARPFARPAAAAVHPFVTAFDADACTGRHAELADRYALAARRQLVGSLQVHVALGDQALVLPTYNRLREHLPVLGALGAAAPFYAGSDSGMASVRPLVAGQLPRQGIPPALLSWEHFAAELAWGVGSGALPEVKQWWWDLRPHPLTGTLEIRVLDVQPTVAATRALVGLTVALVRRLAADVADELADRTEPPEPVPTWRIEENRWSAMRYGTEGAMVDVRTGERRPTRLVAEELISTVEPDMDVGSLAVRSLVGRNAASTLRSVGLDASVDWLCAVFG